MKHIKQALALLLSLALLLGMAAVAEEAEAPVEAESVEELVEEQAEEGPVEPAEEPAEEVEAEPEAEREAEAPEEEPIEETPAEEPEAEPVAEEEFSVELEDFGSSADDFVVVDGVLTEYHGKDTVIVIPSDLGIKAIGTGAFSHSRSTNPAPEHITSITVPEGVTSIEKQAFAQLYDLTSVSLPDTLETIGTDAFIFCPLTSIDLPDSLTRIESGAFEGCASLTSVSIPGRVEYVGLMAFAYCESLETVILEKELCDRGTSGIVFKDHVFDYAYDFDDYTGKQIQNVIIECEDYKGDNIDKVFGSHVTSLKLPAKISSTSLLANNLRCSALDIKAVELPEGLQILPNRAFINCRFLESVSIPNGITSIPEQAFDGCSNLTEVNIPSSVKSIEYDAFRNCTSLKRLVVPNSVTSMDNPFSGQDGDTFFKLDITLVVGKGSYAEKFCKLYGFRYEYQSGSEPVGDATVILPFAEKTLSQKETVTLKPSTEGLSKKESYTFSSSDTNVASVSKTGGKITAKNPGTAVITAKGKTSKQSATCTVTVISAPQTVRIEKPSKLDYTTDDAAFALAASVEPPEAVQGVKWTSSDESVARVSDDGQVTLVGQGKATIKATTEKKGTNGKKRSASVTLNVTDPHMPASVLISEKASAPLYVNKGETLALHSEMKPVTEGQEVRSGVIWSIPAKQQKYATIDAQTGVLQAKDLEGSVTVTVKTEKKGGTGSKKKQLTDTVKITVVDPSKPRAVTINEGEKEIPLYYEAGKTLALQATIEPATATPGVKWSISSKAQRKIATVDASTGVVTPTGNKFGVVTVKVETTAKKSNKKAATATIKIAVVDPKLPYSVKITKEDGTELQDGVELKAGETLKLNASIEPETATEKTGLTWSISKSQKKYATVDDDGTVHGVKSGKTVTVTVKTANGKKDTIKVKVVP